MMAGPAGISNGVVLIRDGKIERVDLHPKSRPKDLPTLQAKVADSRLIDSHTVVGRPGYFNQPQDQDQLERSSSLQPDLRAIDA
jgi:imidazolonepropionase-like amidohydrolase